MQYCLTALLTSHMLAPLAWMNCALNYSL
jgi:hypothetical protein